MPAFAAPLLLFTTYAISGAELHTTDSWQYGRFEARAQFASGNGVVSTFFLWKPGSEMSNVFWNEIDIEKIGPECSYAANVFWGMPEMQMPEVIDLEADICDAWHIHTIEWTPEAIVWKLDGEELRRVEGEIAAAFAANAQEGMQFRFNIWVGTSDFGGTLDPGILPVYQFVDWAEYSEYTPGAGNGGSDFTPAWREDFNGGLPSGWATGNWGAPLGQSTHAPENVVVVDGVAVLALTQDNALGFDGVPPATNDSGDDSTSNGSSDSDSSGDSDESGTSGGDSTSEAETSTSEAETSTDTSGDADSDDDDGDAESDGGNAESDDGDDESDSETSTSDSETSSGDSGEDDDSSGSDDSGEASSEEGSETSESEGASPAEAKGCSCSADREGRSPLASLWGLLIMVGLRRSRNRVTARCST